MYLSRIKLDTTRSKTMKALASPNIFHGSIEATEDVSKDKLSRKLWRVDNLNGNKYLLILSHKKIDFSTVAEQFGYDNTVETKDYSPFLERIVNGSRWNFRLKANPTVCKFNPERQRNQIFAHITTEFQEEWLKKQAEKNGFVLTDGEWLVTGSERCTFWRKGDKKPVRIMSVTYEGILTVTDAEAFRNALTNGIGREKAYGFGLLTIVSKK